MFSAEFCFRSLAKSKCQSVCLSGEFLSYPSLAIRNVIFWNSNSNHDVVKVGISFLILIRNSLEVDIPFLTNCAGYLLVELVKTDINVV